MDVSIRTLWWVESICTHWKIDRELDASFGWSNSNILMNDIIRFLLILGKRFFLIKHTDIRVQNDSMVRTSGRVPVRNNLNMDTDENNLITWVYEKNQSKDKNISLEPPTCPAGENILVIASGYFILQEIDAVISWT